MRFSSCCELTIQCLTTIEYDPSLKGAVSRIARQVEHDQWISVQNAYYVCIYIYILYCLAILDSKLKCLLFGARWPAWIRIPGSGDEKKCPGRPVNLVLVNFVGFYRKKASPAPTPFQIEAIVSESVFLTNCFYLKRTWLPEALGLLLFEYLLSLRPGV